MSAMDPIERVKLERVAVAVVADDGDMAAALIGVRFVPREGESITVGERYFGVVRRVYHRFDGDLHSIEIFTTTHR